MEEKDLLDKLRELILKGETKKLISQLVHLTKEEDNNFKLNKEIKSEIILLSARFEDLLKKQREGIIDIDKFDIKKNNINKSLIELIEKIGEKAVVPSPPSNRIKILIGGLGSVILLLGFAYYFLVYMPSQQGSTEFKPQEEEEPGQFIIIEDSPITNPPKPSRIHEPTNSKAPEKKKQIETVSKQVSVTPKDSLPDQGTSLSWKRNNSTDSIFFRGEHINQNIKKVSSGKDCIVYNKINGTTYLFENYYNIKDGKLRDGKLLSSQPESILWKANKDNYVVYFQGEIISRIVTSSWSVDDFLIFNPKNGYTYIIKNYASGWDYKLRTGEVISEDPENILWRAKGTNFTIYYKGENLTKKRIKHEFYGENDYRIKNKKNKSYYILENYKNRKDNKLRISEKE
ncbi:MAG: hypothetical protein MRZ79_26945 [Bacteroidia bacterium]|nr:hypothetical protein [Bacteroidia bacterium]